MTVAIAALTVAVAAPAGGAPAEKVDVCHAEGSGDYHMINVNENAFETHVGHGDASPRDGVPGQPGMAFDDDCVPTPSVAVGSFSNPYNGSLLTTGFTLYQAGDGTYFGTASYSYGGARSATIEITDACVDEASKRVTVRGDVTAATGSISVGDAGFISIRDNGPTVSTRAGFGTEAVIDGYFAVQCGSSPLFPASGSTGSLTFAP